eukprot:302440-Rhodomonas_salina.1
MFPVASHRTPPQHRPPPVLYCHPLLSVSVHLCATRGGRKGGKEGRGERGREKKPGRGGEA